MQEREASVLCDRITRCKEMEELKTLYLFTVRPFFKKYPEWKEWLNCSTISRKKTLENVLKYPDEVIDGNPEE